ncbi:MAG TPA: hypothetical protein VFX35_06930 [Solirubrobacterales bacterium]|nr:hypothetical protein [Solirubrobacterales bacterium]
MSRRAPIALLVVALAASATLLFSLTSHLTFVGDGWNLLAARPDWSVDTFLEPFNEHPIVIPAFVYKVLLAVFGMESARPFYVVSISLFLLCAVLLFLFLRRRVGDWGALAAAVVVLFLGAAYEDLLWEFQMGFFGSMAAGIGALLALDREDRAGDVAASALLVVATAFSTLGIPFVLAAAAQVAVGPRPRRRRAFVFLIPLALYAIWWLVSGHAAGGQIGLEDLPRLPGYVFEVAGAGIASLLGQQPIDAEGQPPLLAELLALLLAGALIYRLARRREVPPGLIVALVLLFSFWLLIALDRGPQRFSSRFQYPSAVFLLIVAAEALRGVRLSRAVAAVLVAVTAAAVIGGASLLHQGYTDRWKPTAGQIRATLAVIDIAGPAAHPRYAISLPPSIFLPVAKYREAKRRHGTPAYSEAQLLAAAEENGQIADLTLVGALGLGLRTPSRGAEPKACRTVNSSNAGNAAAQLAASGEFLLDNRSSRRVNLGVRRFSPAVPTQLGYLPAGASRSLRLPRDRSPRPWALALDGGPVRLCVL